MQLHETARPTEWADVVGQGKAVDVCRGLIRRGLGGRAVFITGGSGGGKTTIARLLAAEIADPFCIEEIDAGSLTVAGLRDIEREMQFRGMGAKDGRAFLLNEAHGLRKDVIRQLLVLLERLPSHVLFVFTTTTDGADSMFEDCDDASPLLSRCVPIALARRDLARPFAERVRNVAIANGLDSGLPLEAYVKLMQRHKNNCRAAFQSVEAGEMLSE